MPGTRPGMTLRGWCITGRSDASHRRPASPAQQLRLDPHRPQIAVVHVLQRHRHYLGRAVDFNVAEELEPEAWRKILALLCAASVLVHHLRPERVVDLARPPGSRVQRPRDELPE